ncbi:MAG TPA: hypothetical protein VF101_13270 [Gaiellaceae bacterium]
MRRRLLVTLSSLLLVLALPLVAFGDVGVGPGGGTPGTSLNFELVGANPLYARGMNAAITLYDHYAYIGNRTDGSSTCGIGDPRRDVDPNSCPHPHPGILIADIANPASPTIVGEIGPPYAGQVGITTRELRVWPQKKLLMVMTFRCSSVIHACPPGNDTTFPFDIKFFDLSDPVHPAFISSYVPISQAGQKVKPHEMYLWVDPKNANRALLWLSTPSVSASPTRPNLMIVDISDVASGGAVKEVAEGNWNQFFPGASDPATYDFDLSLHSMTPSFDGTRTYLAYLRGGFGVLDTSNVANDQVPTGSVENLNDDLLTPVPFPTWGTGPHCEGHTPAGCAESHSAVPLPGRPFALTIDEVYGTFTVPSFGWPWGWARLWNIAQPRQPRIVGEYKILQNTSAYTPAPGENEFNSYSSHNPTVLRDLIFDSWHSGGEQAIDVSDPGAPVQAGWFSPTPLGTVANEDPALSRGPNKVVVWSFPIIRNGLIYVVDIRNGLFVLRYTGPHADEAAAISFLEGNSNLGDAGRLAKSAGP